MNKFGGTSYMTEERLCFIFIQYSDILNNFVKLFKSAIFKDFDSREISCFIRKCLSVLILSKIFNEI